MLTLNEIEKIRLGKARVGGYKAEDVDNFIDKVRDSYEKLQNDNAELVAKVKVLAHRVNEYRNQEESVRNALIKAQKIEDDTIEESKTRADEIIKKAKEEAEKITSQAKQEILKEKETLSNLKKSVREFRSNILSLYKEHLKLINSLNSEDRVSEDKIKEINKNANNINQEATENKAATKENDSEKSNVIDSTRMNRDKVNEKFKDLKFGENYDLKADNEPPVRLFNSN
ncbi:MAG: DivIVA domain-containing protein [Clostridia bacterium]|nr:DivIVA domain-containing protein [Clostridia bacterium]